MQKERENLLWTLKKGLKVCEDRTPEVTALIHAMKGAPVAPLTSITDQMMGLQTGADALNHDKGQKLLLYMFL